MVIAASPKQVTSIIKSSRAWGINAHGLHSEQKPKFFNLSGDVGYPHQCNYAPERRWQLRNFEINIHAKRLIRPILLEGNGFQTQP
jgi:hypothetical protein